MRRSSRGSRPCGRRRQLVLSLYYEKEQSMKEIAQVLNVSAPQDITDPQPASSI